MRISRINEFGIRDSSGTLRDTVETPHMASPLMVQGGGLFLGEGAEALTENLGALHDVDEGVRVNDVKH